MSRMLFLNRPFQLPAFLCVAFCLGLVSLSQASEDYSMKDFETMPINIVEEGVTPKVMLATSNDQQLYYEAYNDFTDLNDDGIVDTGYDNDIDYYGYFDSYKCYVYDTSDERFIPKEISKDKYCTEGSDQWSGNFLNWATMVRIDTIRKILFGGHRRVDTASQTVLERAYLPTDVHSFAKHYAGSDLPKLTPFTRKDYDCDEDNLSSGCGGDRLKMGITLGNTTDVDYSFNNATYSEEYTDPPRIKVVKGNYSLWDSNERRQCAWKSNAPDNIDLDGIYKSGGGGYNSNVTSQSGIYAYANSPDWSARLGEGNYIARVEVCVKGLIGEENCKLYPGTDGISGTSDDVYKPIGILQTYGDEEEMEFGMVAGSYIKHAKGGDVVKHLGPITDEINVDTDGTFPLVAKAAGGPSENNKASGLINSWSLYRIVGYYAIDGTYNKGDGCSSYTDGSIAYQTKDSQCQNWVNPFSEIYYSTVYYLAGSGNIGDYQANDSSIIDGLDQPTSTTDPIDDADYCADLFIINLNTSTPSYDYDELDATNYAPKTIWDEDDLPGDKTSSAMANAVGNAEGITGNTYFIGETSISDSSISEDQLCTAKTITNFGEAAGVCPEAPRNGGSYRIAGLAYYAHIKDIRPDSHNNRKMESDQTITTFSVAMSSGAPVMEIPNPKDTTAEPLVTLLPACRDQRYNPDGNCTLVSFKVVDQDVDANSGTASGKYYMAWEVTEMGSDYDQDMWGTLSYKLDLSANTISVTTEVHAQSSGGYMGFGYVISGTSEHDGFHAHSGINGFSYPETMTLDEGYKCDDANGCHCRSDTSFGSCNASDSGPSTITYKLGTAQASLLEDPLWYAAKYGGFNDSNGNDLPDLVSEWDAEINATGDSGSDGIPDNFYYATNPRELETALTRTLNAILNRTSSGTAVAIVSANVDGDGAVYQAYYEPKRKSTADTSVSASWFGTLNALWLDSDGNTRQDCTPPADNAVDANGHCQSLSQCVPNGQLDNYCVDQVVETYYDEQKGVSRMRIYESGDPDTFSPYSMQGVVSSFASGSVTMVPYSMEGIASYSYPQLTISPYKVTGTVYSYDAGSGLVTMTIASGDWNGGAGESFSYWAVTDLNIPATGYTEDTITIAAGSVSFTVAPAGTWIVPGDTISLSTKNVTGATGYSMDNWVVTCLEGASATGTIDTESVRITNNSDSTATINETGGSFDTCTRAKFESYDMTGTEGASFSSWEITNLENNYGRGTSGSTMQLVNNGSVSFTVSPVDAWLTAGDQILVANFTTSVMELHEVSYLWDAREQLYLPTLTESELLANRNYSTESASTGRYITTWVDKNLDQVVDSGEYRAFIPGMLSTTDPVSYTFFDVTDTDTAEDLISYIRGVEDSTGQSRNRTIQYSADDSSANVMRLGDIVNSTPVSVSSPQESFDLLYYDTSYKDFKVQYIDRRVMVYAGGNDGLLHAFNGGFYTEETIDGEEVISFSTEGTRWDGSAAVEHPLGSEMWAYAPMNLLPHLQWLKDTSYANSHVSFIDAKPKVFDAKIFTPDSDHPNGYGTVMVVGMNLGGGEMTIGVDNDNDGSEDEEVSFRSAYIVMDITNPEVAPKLLGEIRPPDGSFTSVFPVVAAFQDVGSSTSCTQSTSFTACAGWYLIFGSGPEDLTVMESSESAKIYLFDLKQLTGLNYSSANTPTGCSVVALNDSYNAIQCDTGIANTFVGSPVTVDWDLDFRADTLYFGLIRDSKDSADNTTDGGRVFRMSFEEEQDPTLWQSPTLFFNAERPISIGVQPIPAIDAKSNHWLFFGSGRYLSAADKTTTETESLFGVKDYESGTYPLYQDYLLDVTDAEIYTDGNLVNPITAMDGTTDLSTFTEILSEINSDRANGWYLDLPPIIGTQGVAPATRSFTNSRLISNILLTTVFQPSTDPCEGEGNSRLYGLYYLTGTGYPSFPALGTTIDTVDGEVKYVTNRYIDLGSGSASSPSFHSGSGEDGVFIQMSTGDTVQIEVETPESTRARRVSWADEDIDEPATQQ